MNVDEDWPPLVDVIYHEGPCIIVNKPAGVATQAPQGIPSVELMVRTYIRDREGKSEADNFYLGVPHRLDRPVTGVIAFGRHVRATKRIGDQFAARTVKKSYWALVDAAATESMPETGTWRDWLRKIPGQAHVEVANEGDDGAKSAVLHYTFHETIGAARRIEIELETGRTHQIRVQCASRGLPILGDTQYGSDQTFGPVVTDPRRAAIALHARTLQLLHPMTRDAIEVTGELPGFWPSLG